MDNTNVLEINYQHLDGTACYAPYVSVVARGLYGEAEGKSFDMRIDTGADITCIPRDTVKILDLKFALPMRVRGHCGKIERVRPRMVAIHINNGDDTWIFTPKRGVLLTKSPIGLLGMDVLRDMVLHMEDERLVLSRKGEKWDGEYQQ